MLPVPTPVHQCMRIPAISKQPGAIVMFTRRALIITGLLSVTGCARAPQTPVAGHDLVKVYKNEGCDCCEKWVAHLKQAGFPVEVHDIDNLGPTKDRVGIPPAMGSCHTAEAGGYFVEGHVPADDIKRLLRERPDAKGLTVPAMPLGSPGMEVPGMKNQPYDVFLVSKDGSTSVYAHHGA